MSPIKESQAIRKLLFQLAVSAVSRITANTRDASEKLKAVAGLYKVEPIKTGMMTDNNTCLFGKAQRP